MVRRNLFIDKRDQAQEKEEEGAFSFSYLMALRSAQGLALPPGVALGNEPPKPKPKPKPKPEAVKTKLKPANPT